MSTHQQLVDEIRGFLYSTDQTYNDRLRELADGYVRLCQEANNRLRRCEEFLQKGLRSEAIHFAQADPPLLDVLAAIDFPERPQWEEMALMYNLPMPPELYLPSAEALNRAYAEEQPLEHLLKQHRRLALARAPLAERLSVLRQLASLDPMNPVWNDDVAEFERHRVKQFASDIQNALKNRDVQACMALWNEISTQNWSVPPPQDLMQQLSQFLSKVNQKQIRERLGKLAEDIHDCYANQDENAVARLLQEWNQLLFEGGISPADPITRRVQAASQWLARVQKKNAERQAYEEALRALKRVLAMPDAGIEDIIDARDKLEMLGAIDALVEREIEDRIAQIQANRSRKENMIMMIVLCVSVLGLIGFIVFLIVR